jgi:hypothetical protein
MGDETRRIEELWGMVETLSQHVDTLKASLESQRRKNTELDIENAGWLEVYRTLQSQTVGLKAEISRLESRIQDYQRGS